ncbi:aconitate hydratase [Aestuariibacter halophilus]|uniref:Aconitate hydratase n=1 Tax=Fluctibacter halophilus TaxID=226011 RepID=A0ABS8G700_9ALTE|nr:aconitate hydratase [Aestuariibacter halophilus]MCC2616367.1 aconitate hydratase [Aestuariibacter halophilus]
MARNVAQQLIHSHLTQGQAAPGESIGLTVDQTLCQDATGTLVMLTLEAMGLDRVKTEVSAQYVDHNLIQEDHKNPDDHAYLRQAAQRFGVWFSRPGNGISHPLHMQRFAIPGKVLIGSDSHTCANGCMGMLAMGAGGADVAMAMAGNPVYINMPNIWGIELTGHLPDWVSAKDVILTLLQRHGVSGGVGKVLEYYGPGVATLSMDDRHVIANMGAELGATASVFPSDDVTRRYLGSVNRADQWVELRADKGCDYDEHEHIDLSKVEPMIAKPSSPGNVVPVREVVGEPIGQAYIGSSANPGYRDYAVAAEMVKHRRVPSSVSFDINPSSRDVLQQLSDDKHLSHLISGGARLHQAGCNGCIGMGQAPATKTNSLRTTPRNFPGRSGTADDRVWLCSPETATASALAGEITDPRSMDMAYPTFDVPRNLDVETTAFDAPVEGVIPTAIERGPNIAPLPDSEPVGDTLDIPVLLKVGDDVSTDEILPAGAEVLPYRSNIPKIAEYTYHAVDPDYVQRAMQHKSEGGHAIVGGANYGQGSSREHAALAPRYLGLQAVIARSFARIHFQNLVNFGVLPLVCANDEDHQTLQDAKRIELTDVREAIAQQKPLKARIDGTDNVIELDLSLSQRQRDILLAGGIVPWARQQ